MSTHLKAVAHAKFREPTEREIQQGVKNVLRDLGFWFVDTSQPFKAAITPGLADLIVMGRGVIAFVECKTRTGRLSSAQMSFKAHVENNGGLYIVVKSSADIAAWVNELPKRPRNPWRAAEQLTRDAEDALNVAALAWDALGADSNRDDCWRAKRLLPNRILTE